MALFSTMSHALVSNDRLPGLNSNCSSAPTVTLAKLPQFYDLYNGDIVISGQSIVRV